ncbi:MAG: hypothetical protein A2X28_03000 [Elusimicrobia bacterium GWA2_56_46]|nr:MAG: hypothetical protein A2X28_03000 [Elusimicrobia bacterium GWA2_56_46]OGR54197.1 MAG: hypothetical protein A2X39_08945 [Elusimicrobia bacterium GWC2_56_31]HBB68264.1 hypothetical protein [Elusimicrobiota bacterium]HBW21774.1 hypothetical protein [Elusimicrobiota bacterium]
MGGQEDPGLDVLIIGGEIRHEIAEEHREKGYLRIGRAPATLRALRAYFGSGGLVSAAEEDLRFPGFVPRATVYLQQRLSVLGLRAEALHTVSGRKEELDSFLRRRPRVVAISTTFIVYSGVVDSLAAYVKSVLPGAVVVAGGPLIWKSHRILELTRAGSLSRESLEGASVHHYFIEPQRPTPLDAAVISPTGAEILSDLALAVCGGRPWDSVKGLARYRGGRWHMPDVPAASEEMSNVDWNLAFPAASDKYFPVASAEGCAFRCRFCDFSSVSSGSRDREVSAVIAEIFSIPESEGVRRVFFTDDNLFPSLRRASDLMGAMISSGMKIYWTGFIRPEIIDAEIADLMRASGCREALLGVESGDPGVRSRMGKSDDIGRILGSVKLLHERGIHTKNYFLVGFPGETEQTLKRTVELLNSYPDDASAAHRHLFLLFIPLAMSYAGSLEGRKLYGLRGYGGNWSHSTFDSTAATDFMKTLPSLINPWISPAYPGEIPELPGLLPRDVSRIYYLRNRLAAAGFSGSDTGPLWEEMRAVFSPGS